MFVAQEWWGRDGSEERSEGADRRGYALDGRDVRGLSRRLRLCGVDRRNRQGGAGRDPRRSARRGAAGHPSARHQRARDPEDRQGGGTALRLRGDHRARFDQRRGRGDAERRAGFPGQAVHQGPAGGDGAQRRRPCLAGTDRRNPEGRLRPRRLSRHHRFVAADAGDLSHHRFGGAVPRHRVHFRRIRTGKELAPRRSTAPARAATNPSSRSIAARSRAI